MARTGTKYHPRRAQVEQVTCCVKDFGHCTNDVHDLVLLWKETQGDGRTAVDCNYGWVGFGPISIHMRVKIEGWVQTGVIELKEVKMTMIWNHLTQVNLFINNVIQINSALISTAPNTLAVQQI